MISGMTKEDIIRGIFVAKNDDALTLIFIKDGVAEEYNFLDSFGLELVEAMIDKLKTLMVVFNEEIIA